MRKQFGILSSFFASLCAICAYVMLAAVLCALSACTPTGEAEIPSPSLPAQAGQPPAVLSQEPSAQPTVQPAQAAFPEIPLDDDSLSIPVPDFLDQDQQLLYRQAHAMYGRLFGGDTSEVCIGSVPDLDAVAELNGITYTKATGLYAAWADFDAMVHSLFTDRFWTARNAIQRGERFVNIDGALYFLDVSMGGYYRNERFPDTFTLISQTDDEIAFTLTGYYSSPWPNEGETVEARDRRLEDGWDYTLDFNLNLVRTAEGWRFDEFHATAADQEDPETAALINEAAAR